MCWLHRRMSFREIKIISKVKAWKIQYIICIIYENSAHNVAAN